MYAKILAAVNEHLNSEISARYAIHLAKTTASKLYVCYVAGKHVPGKDLARAEETVKRLFHMAKDMDVDAECIIDSGNIVREIKRIVESEQIDIVFSATRREDVEKRFYEGTTARRLSVGLPCSVALVRVVHMGRIHPKEVLIPLNSHVDHLNERSYFAAMMARSFDAGIFLFHARPPLKKFFHGEVHLTPRELEKNLPADISKFIERLESYEVGHEKLFVQGKAWRTIPVEASAKRFDLIIMGASERTLISAILEGNPVEKVLRSTPCDLIIFRARHEDK